MLSFSKTSADPDFEVKALLPCFATFIFMLASTIDAAVEIFKVCFPSPPVPHMSRTSSSKVTFKDFSLNIEAPPVI
jgi:hypothetical protein